MQTAGHFIDTAAKFPSRVQDRIDDTRRRDFLRWVKIDWHAPPVVFDRHAAIFFQCNVYFRTKTSQMFINSIVKYFPDQVVQSPRPRTSYVHAGALTDRL